MRHVPLEQRSTTRLGVSLIVWTVVPGALIILALCLAAWGFLSAAGDYAAHLPTLF